MSAVDELGTRGAALWKSIGAALGTARGDAALEACRIVDRLEVLDGIITGRGTLGLVKFHINIDETESDVREIHVQIDIQRALQEARQQQQTLKNLLETLKAIEPAEVAPTVPVGGGTVLDQLAERRAGRESNTNVQSRTRR